jgi:Bacteriocin-protection, YdeI or OmpD-Associated/Domain of unknown function (DUF1905)
VYDSSPTESKHIFSARIYKQWIMRCVDVPKNIAKALRGEVGENVLHIPVHGRVEGRPLKTTLSPAGNGGYRLHLHSNIWRKLKVDDGDIVEVMLALDTEPRDPALPPDLAAGLADEPRALAIFQSLTPAFRRQIVRYLELAKQVKTREKRVGIIVDNMLKKAAKKNGQRRSSPTAGKSRKKNSRK